MYEACGGTISTGDARGGLKTMRHTRDLDDGSGGSLIRGRELELINGSEAPVHVARSTQQQAGGREQGRHKQPQSSVH